MKQRKQLRKHEKRCKLSIESLEQQVSLAANLGWDGPGQGGVSLSYYIADVPTNVGLEQVPVETAIASTSNAWSNVVDLTFTQTTLAR